MFCQSAQQLRRQTSLRSECIGPPGNPQSSSFEEASYIKTNPERAYGKARSRGGDANTVLEVVSGFQLHGVSVSLQQCVFMQKGK